MCAPLHVEGYHLHGAHAALADGLGLGLRLRGKGESEGEGVGEGWVGAGFRD